MIKVKNLTKSFIHNGKKIYIFRNLSFEIKKGESIALLGEKWFRQKYSFKNIRGN